jgi:hypothetical protein
METTVAFTSAISMAMYLERDQDKVEREEVGKMNRIQSFG